MPSMLIEPPTTVRQLATMDGSAVVTMLMLLVEPHFATPALVVTVLQLMLEAPVENDDTMARSKTSK